MTKFELLSNDAKKNWSAKDRAIYERATESFAEYQKRVDASLDDPKLLASARALKPVYKLPRRARTLEDQIAARPVDPTRFQAALDYLTSLKKPLLHNGRKPRR